MKKILKVFGIIVLIIFVAVTAIAVYAKFALPNIGPAPDLTIERTPERISRGEYLANSVAVCMDCHSIRDFSLYAGPIDKKTFGAGGEKFGKELGFPGNLYSKNITPYRLQHWTDGEIFRAITSGVSKNGQALFPLMPYQRYGEMDNEDIYAIIAYIRTLTPVKSEIPERELDFPLNFIVNTIPEKGESKSVPDMNNSTDYGKYLINAASCVECHSKSDKGELLEGTEFGGGGEFKSRGGVVYSSNITPDKETGIGTWTKQAFIKRFKQYQDTTYHSPKLKQTDFNTPMPWIPYSTMTEKDLGAIYDYLQTVKPLKHSVKIFETSNYQLNK